MAEPVDVTFIEQIAKVNTEEAIKRVDDTVKAVEASHHVYRCIEKRAFAVPRIQKHHAYSRVKALLNDPEFRLLELGCCFGTDARKLLFDGLSLSRLVISDLHDEYWKIGRDILFKDNLDLTSFWADFSDASINTASFPPIEQPFSVVSSQAMLHVFSKTQVRNFVANIHKVLKPGGILFGSSGISAGATGFEWGETPSKGLSGRKVEPRYLYSSDELTQLFHEIGFEKVEIECGHFRREGTNSDDNFGDKRAHVSFLAYKK